MACGAQRNRLAALLYGLFNLTYGTSQIVMGVQARRNRADPALGHEGRGRARARKPCGGERVVAGLLEYVVQLAAADTKVAAVEDGQD
jgi:hypothetical protein